MASQNVVFEGNEGLMGEFKTSKYMSAFHDIFHVGTEKDVAKWYTLALLAKANDFYHKGVGADGMIEIRTISEAFKQARISMQQTMTKLNPNKAMIDWNDGKSLRNKKSVQFLQWLGRKEYNNIKNSNPKMSDKQIWDTVFKQSKDIKMLKNLENQYAYKMKRLRANLPGMFTDANLTKLLKSYNIPIHSMF